MRAGLVSISFRNHTVAEVVAMARSAGLESIEWGGDIHVPHGDLRAAREAAAMTADHGMRVSAYGSYLRLGVVGGPDPEEVIATGVALGAPTIRVWAGAKSPSESTPEDRARVVGAALRAAAMADKAGLSLSYEFHGGTLTETAASAAALLGETPGIRCFWQPPVGLDTAACLASLEAVLPRLSNVHAFHWWPTSSDRLPLAEGAGRWNAFLGRIRAAGPDPDVSLEFMPGDSPDVLATEAASLRRLLDG
jgi:3-dehydroshikimate dehydratase